MAGCCRHTEVSAVDAQEIGRNMRITAVIFGFRGDKAVQLLRIDGEDLDAGLERGLDNWTGAALNADADQSGLNQSMRTRLLFSIIYIIGHKDAKGGRVPVVGLRIT
jgi:hypothetical protein